MGLGCYGLSVAIDIHTRKLKHSPDFICVVSVNLRPTYFHRNLHAINCECLMLDSTSFSRVIRLEESFKKHGMSFQFVMRFHYLDRIKTAAIEC